MIKYNNIKKDGSIELSENKKYNKNELINRIKHEIINANIKLKEIKHYKESQYLITIELDDKNFTFITLIKNISGAGWADKPDIKRVQVKNIKLEAPESLHVQSEKIANLIMGYYNYDSNPIFVCWDAYRYLNHETIRSCYISVEGLQLGYVKGFYEGVYASQKVWVFSGDFFEKFFRKYIDYIKFFYGGLK